MVRGRQTSLPLVWQVCVKKVCSKALWIRYFTWNDTYDPQWAPMFIIWSAEGLWRAWNWTLFPTHHTTNVTVKPNDNQQKMVNIICTIDGMYIISIVTIFLIISKLVIYKVWLKHITLKRADIWVTLVLQKVLTLHNSIIDFAKSPGRKTYHFPLSSELTWWQSVSRVSLKDFCSVLLRIFDNLLLCSAVRQTTWLTTGRARALSL